MKFHWGNSILIFFIFFLSLCGIFIVFSLRQQNDLVTDDYYEQGANYTRQMKIMYRSEPYEDSIQIKQENNLVRFYLSESIIEKTDSIEIYFYRSSDKSKDVLFREELVKSPVDLNAQLFIHGRYTVKIGWTDKTDKFEIQKTLDIN